MRTQISIDLQEPDPDQFLEEMGGGGRGDRERGERELTLYNTERGASSEWLTIVIITT